MSNRNYADDDDDDEATTDPVEKGKGRSEAGSERGVVGRGRRRREVAVKRRRKAAWKQAKKTG